jgi:hypothetical protein
MVGEQKAKCQARGGLPGRVHFESECLGTDNSKDRFDPIEGFL